MDCPCTTERRERRAFLHLSRVVRQRGIHLSLGKGNTFDCFLNSARETRFVGETLKRMGNENPKWYRELYRGKRVAEMISHHKQRENFHVKPPQSLLSVCWVDSQRRSQTE